MYHVDEVRSHDAADVGDGLPRKKSSPHGPWENFEQPRRSTPCIQPDGVRIFLLESLAPPKRISESIRCRWADNFPRSCTCGQSDAPASSLTQETTSREAWRRIVKGPVAPLPDHAHPPNG
uniref:Uncharacterized protein n=1 Tax=Coccidioides posadasii RMSCC 3488 TaxID=454284 RepID=A0A0J6F6N3_COCPO|nr:hypothetical protein CPAG_02186 [Coccidioides posadasii RMSCC 3488]